MFLAYTAVKNGTVIKKETRRPPFDGSVRKY